MSSVTVSASQFSVAILGENDTSTVVLAVTEALEMASLQKGGRLHIRRLF
jgi:hypothetical protein